MFELALAIGLYSYLILCLGLLGRLAFYPVAIVSVLFWGFFTIVNVKRKKGIKVGWGSRKKLFADKFVLFLLLILFLQAIINLIGGLGPELSFDALWYHLTLAKLYVHEQRIFYIPGGLLYYSTMPRLGEMLYSVALIFNNEILAKLIHWGFGLLSSLALFQLLRRYLNPRFGFLGIMLFYTLLVVGWQSTTAYVDLIRTFFELLALTYFLYWLENKGNWLFKSGLMMGFSLCTKHLGLETLAVFLILILFFSQKRMRDGLTFLMISLTVALPWYCLSWLNTGYPFYPLFTPWFTRGQIGEWGQFFTAHNPLLFFTSPWSTTFHLDNLLSPVFLILLPLVLAKVWKQKRIIKITALYAFLGYFFWFLTPPSSARYLLPFLLALILVSLKTLTAYRKPIQQMAIGAIVLACCLNLGARAMATKKFLPVVFGQQSKTDFLSQNLNFAYGDFYDVDGFFKENIKENDLVLISGIHNLYYVDFPFVHESWAKPSTKYNHLLIREGDLPKEFNQAKLIYENAKTQVKLYELE
ncbi:MAG: glycosyltransferase family 39 protein [Candidatus Marinimicrobia bacterium]|nr:glycosyltransferase family 39 protein [Candidatus Neomarinimicrobiota bacterium]